LTDNGEKKRLAYLLCSSNLFEILTPVFVHTLPRKSDVQRILKKYCMGGHIIQRQGRLHTLAKVSWNWGNSFMAAVISRREATPFLEEADLSDTALLDFRKALKSSITCPAIK